jgi:hypothetical protein
MNMRLTVGLVLSTALPVLVVLGSVPSGASKNFSRYATARALAAQGETIQKLRKKRLRVKSATVRQSSAKPAKVIVQKTATVSASDQPVSKLNTGTITSTIVAVPTMVEQTVAGRPETSTQQPPIGDKTRKTEGNTAEAYVVPRVAEGSKGTEQAILEAEKQRLAHEDAPRLEVEKKAQVAPPEPSQVNAEITAQESEDQTGNQRIASVEKPDRSASAKLGYLGSQEGSKKCKKAKSDLEEYAYSNIEIKNCKGKTFEFIAERDGKGFTIRVSAGTREIIEVARSPEAVGQEVP